MKVSNRDFNYDELRSLEYNLEEELNQLININPDQGIGFNDFKEYG